MNIKRLSETFLLALLWAPAYLLARLAIDDVGPFALVSLRVCIGGLLLWLFLIFKTKKILLTRDMSVWMHSFVLGFLSNGFPFVAFAYSVQYIPTSLSALLNGIVPIVTITLAHFILEDEKLTWNRTFGVLLGLMGFMVIFLPTVAKTENSSFDPKVIVLVFLASCSYAIGMIYAKKYIKKTTPPLVVPTLQLVTALIYLVPLAWYFEWPHRIVLNTYQTWACILGLAFFGTSLAFILFHRIIKNYGATAMSMVTYLLPILGTILGVVFLEEVITKEFWIASVLILGGVLMVSRPETRYRRNEITYKT